MSKLLFAGSRTDCVSVVSGALTDSTSYIDTAYSDAGINVASGTMRINFYDPASAPLLAPYAVAAGNSLYFHFYIAMNTNPFGYAGDAIIFWDSSDHPWVKLDYLGQFFYNSGTGPAPVWTAIGTNTYGMPGANQVQANADIRIEIGASGDHNLLMAVNELIAVNTVAFSQPLMTDLAYITCTHDTVNTACVWSQLICTENVSTVGAHVATARADAAGTYSQWLGSYTDVNEVITNYSTYNQALSTDLKQSYDMGNITVPPGSIIKGVFHWLIAKNDGTAPTNIQSICISGATEVETANLNNFGISFSGVGARYDLDPNTGLAWTQTSWNAPVQLGFESKA